MGEIIRFISKAERERIRLIREARAMYDSVFPPSASMNEPRDKIPTTHSASVANVHHDSEALS
jgi:hypothetical protein